MKTKKLNDVEIQLIISHYLLDELSKSGAIPIGIIGNSLTRKGKKIAENLISKGHWLTKEGVIGTSEALAQIHDVSFEGFYEVLEHVRVIGLEFEKL